MYLLYFLQVLQETRIGLFETLEEGREFVKQIPGYQMEKESEFVYERFDPKELPAYLELNYRGNIIPLTTYMFPEEDEVEIEWQELPLLSKNGNGIVAGITKVDAYMVDNHEVNDYIKKREAQYSKVKHFLMEKNMVVDRSFQGSEDGEAIVYQKAGEHDWHFLMHMDPEFVEDDQIEESVHQLLSQM